MRLHWFMVVSFILSTCTAAGTSVAPFTVQIFDKAFGIPASAFSAILVARFALDGLTRPIISTFIDRSDDIMMSRIFSV